MSTAILCIADPFAVKQPLRELVAMLGRAAEELLGRLRPPVIQVLSLIHI